MASCPISPRAHLNLDSIYVLIRKVLYMSPVCSINHNNLVNVYCLPALQTTPAINSVKISLAYQASIKLVFSSSQMMPGGLSCGSVHMRMVINIPIALFEFFYKHFRFLIQTHKIETFVLFCLPRRPSADSTLTSVQYSMLFIIYI